MTEEFICYACRLPFEEAADWQFSLLWYAGPVMHEACRQRLQALTSAAVPREANEKPRPFCPECDLGVNSCTCELEADEKS